MTTQNQTSPTAPTPTSTPAPSPTPAPTPAPAPAAPTAAPAQAAPTPTAANVVVDPNAVLPSEGGEGSLTPAADGDALAVVPEGVYAPVEVEGFVVSPEALQHYSPMLRDAGITQGQFAKLMPILGEFMEAGRIASAQAEAAALEARRAGYVAARDADPEIGGSPQKILARNHYVARAMDRFATPELREVMNHPDLGDHPEMLRFLFRVGMLISEDARGRPSGEIPPTEKPDPIAAMYPNDVLKA